MKKQKIIVIPIILFLMFSEMVFSENLTNEFTLNKCLEYALNNSYLLKKSHFKTLEADAKFDELQSDGLPQISGFARLDHYPELEEQYISGSFLGQDAGIPVALG